MDKDEIRKRMKLYKSQLSRDEIAQKSERITQQLYAKTYYNDATHIYLYVSYNQEVETRHIITESLRRGKHIAVPKVINNQMEFHEISDLQQLSQGAYGILEPMYHNPVYELKGWKQKNLMVLPGLAFDYSGARVGYGGGFYDHYIERFREYIGLKIALAYDFQVMDSINIEEFDEKVDEILIG